VREHLRIAREDRQPTLVEALTYRFRGHSAADPEVYRTKEEVEEWRKRDPIVVYSERLKREGLIDDPGIEEIDRRAIEIVDQAVEFAEQSPEPTLESLYDNVYALGEQVQGWYTVDERTPEVHPGEQEHEVGAAGVAHELAEAGAAHAAAGDVQRRRRHDAATSGPADDAQTDEEGPTPQGGS
jgi:Dehydrogenase E1 component